MLATVCVFLSGISHARQSDLPNKQLFNLGWKFYKGGAVGAESYKYDDTDWRALNLPHDWSIEDLENTQSPFNEKAISQSSGGFTTGGTGWYRKAFNLDKANKDKLITITFDGVYMNSSIWLNGKLLGGNPYGYTEFSFDITDKVFFDKKNIIAVKVNNEGENSRWYSGSGIYRHVWLNINNPIHIANWGTFITTPHIQSDRCITKVETKIANQSADPAAVKIVNIVVDKQAKTVGRSTSTGSVKAGEILNLNSEINLKKFNLWSVENPYLYSLVTKVFVGDKLVDNKVTPFGIRSLKFSTAGFFLNGKPLKLKGGCLHHDNGPLGAKAYDRAEVRKVEILKAAGYNALRASHNPPSHAFLNACDSLGMLVIDEAFDCWNEGKNPNDYSLYFDKNWQRDIDAMVLRDRNHPSIIMWSTGNEIPNRQKPEVAEVSKMLSDYIKNLDTTRPLTSAVNELSPNKDAYFATLDVSGYNYAAGGDHWKEDIYADDHKRVSGRIIYEAEAYPFEAFDSWQKVLEKPYVIGAFVWTALDYIGEASIGWRGYWPDKLTFPWTLAYCGDIDICGNKRPASFYREALWKKDQLSKFETPPVSTFPLNPDKEAWSKWHWFDVAADWNHAGFENKPLDVVVYSSCEEVELFINNVSLGKKKIDVSAKFMGAWSVPYQAGTLKAIGYSNKKQVSISTLQTAAQPSLIHIKADRTKINADGQDLSYVEVSITDKNGVVHPKAENLIKFEIEGGEIVGVGNGKPTSLESYQLPQRKAWQGKCLVIIKSNNKPGKITLKASSEGLASSSLIIQSVN